MIKMNHQFDTFGILKTNQYCEYVIEQQKELKKIKILKTFSAKQVEIRNNYDLIIKDFVKSF